MQTKRSNHIGAIVATAIVVGLAALGWTKQDALYDWWRLRQYQPSAAIVHLATDTTMNDKMRRLFYVYHPDLEQKATFNQHCSDSEKTIVLGCYVSKRGIYLYDVTDPRLKGVLQVTAAHETLHAAYDRLSAKERQHIDGLTAQAYSQVTDQRIKATIDSYRQKDPTVVPNELHSILGTEVQNLPPELETYYKQYFTNRQAIVRFSQAYEQEFTSRQQQVETDDVKLKSLKDQIDALDNTLKAQVSRINADYDRLQSLKRAGQVDEYNAGVAGYNQQVTAYNANVRREQSLVSQYNTLVAERNALALEENELIKAIDSRPATIQTQ